MPKLGTPPTWMELHLDRSGDEIRVRAVGSRGEQTAPQPFGERGASAMLRFADAVRRAVARGTPFDPALIADAQAIHQALLGGEVGPLHGRLREAAGGCSRSCATSGSTACWSARSTAPSLSRWGSRRCSTR